jgi:CAAX prenyl protease-like protein
LSRRTPLFSTVAVSGHAEPAPAANPTASYIAPLLAIALTTMITGSLSESGFDRLYVARVLAGLAVLGYFRHQYSALRVSLSWHAIAIGLAVYAVWTALEPAPPTGAGRTAVSDALASMPRAWAWAWLAARSIGSVIVVPVAEELAFRGYLTRRLIAADFRAVPEGRFTWASFLVSSLLFGLLHQRWLAGSVAGMAYALAYYRRGKLTDAIVAHALTNLLITLSVLATGDWYAWS